MAVRRRHLAKRAGSAVLVALAQVESTLAAIAVRTARAAIETVATGRPVHIEPIGQTRTSVAARERIASAAGEPTQDAAHEYRCKESTDEPFGHEFDPPTLDDRASS